MAQFLRPDGTLASSNISIVGAATAHEAVDETTSSITDFFYSPGDGTARLSMGSPAETPGSGTCTIRWTAVRTNAGATPDTANSGTPTVDVSLYENGSQVSTVTKQTALGTSATVSDSLTFSSSLIGNWANVELFFSCSDNGGGPNNRDGGIAWVEIEVPDPSVGYPAKVWNGSTWVTGIPKVWNGSTWVTGTPKVWGGSSWGG